MKFEFNYSKQTEIDRLIFTYGSIAKGIYAKLGFLLLTENKPTVTLNKVIIPNTTVKLTSEIIKELNDTDLCAGIEPDSNVLKDYFNDKFRDLPLLKKTQIEKFENEWKEIETKFTKIIDSLFPNNTFTKIIIIPTLYGTHGSYHAKGSIIYIPVRIDQTVENSISLIIRAIVHYTFLNIKSEDEVFLQAKNIWDKKEEITDMLMRNTVLKELCPNYRSTIDMIDYPELDEELVKTSKANYEALGFPVSKSLKLNGLVAKLNDKKLENLTETQNNLLINFLKKEGEVVKNEEIAEIMWGGNYHEKYSLSAMAKMIHQLRQKLKSAGLQKEVIFTKRGKGYVLVQ